MRVLIVDDDRDFAFALAGLVRECGHDVVDTVNQGGLAVVQSYLTHRPDLVLMDIQMPRLNGLTVSHALLSRNPRARIVLISGQLDSYDSFVSRAGAIRCLRKPILFEELRDALESVEVAA